jgi:transposase
MASMNKTDRPRTWREGRRLRAWELHQQGWSQRRIAEALGVTAGAVSQWIARGTKGGPEALRTRTSPGAPPRLSPEQRAQLPQFLIKGAEAYGFRGDVWTQARVAAVIKAEFGVAYHRDHIGRLLRNIGWSVQKPVEQANQRDESAIKVWIDERWPAIKKKPQRKDAPSSGEMNRASTCCRPWCARTHPVAKPQSCVPS